MLLLTVEAGGETGRERSLELDGLLSQVAQGSREAFSRLYELTRADVFGFALSLVRSRQQAEDISHDAFLKIWTGAAGYKSTGKPMAWILTITKNLSLMHLREQSRVSDTTAEEAMMYLADDPGLPVEDRHLLAHALKELSEDELRIVTLHAVSGFGHGEIAQMLDLPGATVRTKYRRALAKLKKAIEEGSI